jgi:hypothetical protein
MANHNRRNWQLSLSMLKSAITWLGPFDVQSQGEIKFPSMFGYSKNPEQPEIRAFRSVLQQVHTRFQSEFSTEGDVALPFSTPCILSFPWVIRKLLTSSILPSPFPSKDGVTDDTSLTKY